MLAAVMAVGILWSGLSLRETSAASPPVHRLMLISGFVPGSEMICVRMVAECDGSRGAALEPLGLLLGRGPQRLGLEGPGELLRFSYAVAWRNQAGYRSQDSGEAIATAAHLLGEQLAYWRELYGADVRFDLVGHSLGGAMAAHWAGTTTDLETLGSVHSLAALDSPLAGLDPLEALVFGMFACGNACPGITDLSDPAVRARMADGVRRIDTINVISETDRLVTRRAALITPAPWRQELLSSACIPDDLNCHTSVLADPAAADVIAWAAAHDGPAWSGRHPAE